MVHGPSGFCSWGWARAALGGEGSVGVDVAGGTCRLALLVRLSIMVWGVEIWSGDGVEVDCSVTCGF